MALATIAKVAGGLALIGGASLAGSTLGRKAALNEKGTNEDELRARWNRTMEDGPVGSYPMDAMVKIHNRVGGKS